MSMPDMMHADYTDKASLYPQAAEAPAWRTMYDSIYPGKIPTGAQMAAGYSDGKFEWSDSDWARFPRAAHIRITVLPGALSFPHLIASVIDIETGAWSPNDARQFVIDRDNFRPGTATIYVDAFGFPAVRKACRGLRYNVWLASWTGIRPAPSEVAAMQLTLGPDARLVAWQYASEPDFDVSAVFDPDWHREPRSAE